MLRDAVIKKVVFEFTELKENSVSPLTNEEIKCFLKYFKFACTDNVLGF